MNFQPEFYSSLPMGKQQWILFSPGERQIAFCPEKETPFISGENLESEDLNRKENLIRSLGIGRSDGTYICCGEWRESAELPEGLEWQDFRDVYRILDKPLQFPVSRARQLLNWDRSHRFCGVCGTETVPGDREHSRVCPACGELFYPRLSPAVIVRITRGKDNIMLAHNRNFPKGIYSHIAGFVEAGESLEQTIRREIREEVGLEVENIRYFSSQPWPMPHSLMVAFTAECPEGEPEPDGVEILDAQWFTRENLPLPPSSGSIAMAMLKDFLENRQN